MSQRPQHLSVWHQLHSAAAVKAGVHAQTLNRVRLRLVPVTSSLKVPATMKVRAEVCWMTVNSVHTMRKAMTPPKLMIPAVTSMAWAEAK